MRSRLYECKVMHHRFAPKTHRFSYRIFMLALDLDELGELSRNRRLFSVNRRNVFSLQERDYLRLDEPMHNCRPDAPPALPAGLTLKQRVLALLAQRGITVADARVELVTMPRILGYQFNPVSFYFVSDPSGTPRAALAEVTNTFREVKVFPLDGSTWREGAFRLRVPKEFYVSPFSDVDVMFDFVLRPPAERLAVQIDDYAAGERLLTSTLGGTAAPLTDTRLAWFLLKYPLLTLLVVARIHWHALRLYWKKVPWFAKAARPEAQRELLRPHSSLITSRSSRL